MRKRFSILIILVALMFSFLFGTVNTNAASDLPAVYQTIEEVMEKYPGTRNQSPYGMCWAFAVTACAEFDLINKGIYTKEEADFSELQLAYSKYNSINEPLGYAHGDTVKFLNDEKNYLEVGSSAYSSIANLAANKSFTFEKNMPYERADEVLSGNADSRLLFKNDAAQLKEVYSLDIKKNQVQVKKAIMEHGAVYAEYFQNMFKYNEEYNTYCNMTNVDQSNHAIAIVGWDDTIPKEHFNKTDQPKKDGAWLIRNSWTTETGASEDSYFYMSYEDKSLGNCEVMDFELNQYTHNYQHDGSVLSSVTTVQSAANVFTMKNVNHTNSQRLEAIRIEMNIDSGRESQKFKVEIYTGVDDSKNPKSGYLNKESTTYFRIKEAGIYTISLKKPVLLAPKEKFSIVVTPVEGKEYFVGIEEGTKAHKYDENGEIVNLYETKVTDEPGESYYCYEGKWMDAVEYPETKKYKRGNICIKGLANDSNEKRYLITYKLNGGDNNDDNPSGYKPGTSVELKAPVRKGYKFMGWYTNSSYEKKISKVSSKSSGNVTLYAKWKIYPTLQTSHDIFTGKPVLKWNKVSGMKKFEVYRATSEKGTYSKVYTTTGTTYTHKSATIGKTYYYKVKAISDTGAAGYSDIKTITCKCETPSMSVNTVASSGKPMLCWGTVDGAYKYVIYRATSKDGTYTSVYTAKDEGKYEDKSAKAGTSYYYKMKAFCKKSSKGNSLYSLKYNIICDCARPQVTLKLSSKGKPRLMWEKIAGADKYIIYRATSKNGEYKKLYTTSKCSFINTSAKSGKTYYYKVKAICSKTSKANSASSKSISIKSK